MSVNLSPVGGAGAQFCDNNGNPLNGGKLYTYSAGTTSPAAAYTSAAGSVFQPNPIVLNAGGRVPDSGEIWLSDNISYKFVLKTSADVLIATWDNINGINSNFVNYTVQEEVITATAGQTVFDLSTITYAPATNSLSVYVDGVNQIIAEAYVETDANTVTFVSGLHVGAQVKFTTAVPATGTATNAAVVTYDPAGTGAVPTTVQAKLRESVSVKDFGAVGDGVTDDTAAFVNAAVAAENKQLLIPNGTYLLSNAVAIYPGTTVEGDDSTLHFKADENKDLMGGFFLASNVSVRNLNGFVSTNGYTVTTTNGFINCGLFYGVGNAARAYYAGIIPGITDANSAVGEWDAPNNIKIDTIESDIYSQPTTNSYGNSFISLSNFVRNIEVTNIKVVGFAEYVNYATSYSSSGRGILNDNNYYDAVRFEWGNFVTPAAYASGENIVCENIYGEGLRLHNHSGVVSMGNAHSFRCTNIVGKNTAQVFHCWSTWGDTSLDPSVIYTNASARLVQNITGTGLYTWIDDNAKKCGGVCVNGDFDGDPVQSSVSNVTIQNVMLSGLYDATATPTHPDYGVVIGDITQTQKDVHNVVIENGRVTRFNTGIQAENVKDSKIKNLVISWNGDRGLFIGSESGYYASNITIDGCYFYKNNLVGNTDFATNFGVGATVFRGDNIIFRDCCFGDRNTAAGTETQLNSVFLRNGNVGFVKFDSCIFANYNNDPLCFDINTSTSNIQPIVRDCRSVQTVDYVPKVAGKRPSFDVSVVASGVFSAAPSTVTLSRETNISSATYVSAGRFRFTFETALPNASYYVLVTGGAGSTPEFDVYNFQEGNTTTEFDLFVKDATGAIADPSQRCQFVVLYVESPIDLNQAILN